MTPREPDPPAGDSDFHVLVQTLLDAVGPAVVQVMAAVTDRDAPQRWAGPDEPLPEAVVQRRVRLGYRVWRVLAVAEGQSVALAWLVGSNPRLNDNVPLTYIQDERAGEVLGAALAFVNDIYAP